MSAIKIHSRGQVRGVYDLPVVLRAGVGPGLPRVLPAPCTPHPNSTRYTLHPPTPYTLNPTLHFPYSTPYTLHPTPFISHSTLYTLHPTPHTLHLTLYTLHPTFQTLQSISYTLRVLPAPPHRRASLLLSSLELSDKGVYEP
jgi:hypothetical protein